MLAIAAGILMCHGQLVRHLTSGQLPVTALMSSDNGKAQVSNLFTKTRLRLDIDAHGFLILLHSKMAFHKYYNKKSFVLILMHVTSQFYCI